MTAGCTWQTSLLYFYVSNLTIICLHYPLLLFSSSWPELPSLSASPFQFSVSYGSFYFSIWGLILGTLLYVCKPQIKTDGCSSHSDALCIPTLQSSFADVLDTLNRVFFLLPASFNCSVLTLYLSPLCFMKLSKRKKPPKALYEFPFSSSASHGLLSL